MQPRHPANAFLLATNPVSSPQIFLLGKNYCNKSGTQAG